MRVAARALRPAGNIRFDQPTVTAPAVERGRERVLTEKELAAPRTAQPQSSPAATVALLEATNVLIALLENARGDLRGQLTLTSRWMRKLAESALAWASPRC